MSDMVKVPAEMVQELSAEVYDYPAGFPDTSLLKAARAIVEAVEGVPPTAQDILHRINMQTSLGSVFGSQTEPDTLYMPTALICRLLDGEEA